MAVVGLAARPRAAALARVRERLGGAAWAVIGLCLSACCVAILLAGAPGSRWGLAVALAALSALAVAAPALRARAVRRREGQLELLVGSLTAIQTAPTFGTAVRELLEGARTLLRAERAELVLLVDGNGGSAFRSTLGPAGQRLLEPFDPSEQDRAAIAHLCATGAAAVVSTTSRPSALAGFLDARGAGDAVVALLRRDARVLGVLLVVGPAGERRAFDDTDGVLLDTFAAPAGAALDGERIKEELRIQAFHDTLTGLPNRVLFLQLLEQALAANVARPPVVLLVDLDDFRTTNDSLGHGTGDALLVEVGRRVQACAGAEVAVARLGGDEFGVLLQCVTLAEAERLAERIVGALSSRFAVSGREILLHASVGVAAGSADTRTAGEVLANAELAMYGAKATGRRRYALYEPRMQHRVRRRHELAAALEHAVERDEIAVYFQPIVALATGRTVAVEALSRWMHPRRGLVLPSSFVPLAEETGLMGPIGRKVLGEACKRAREWQVAHAAHRELQVSVNLSPAELQSGRLVSDVEDALAESGLAPGSLLLEITESGAMRDRAATLDALRRLRSLGVRLALDDFGTGHSSLSHLREFPIDVLKIAKPFVERLGSSPEETTFVDAILRLARTLELEVVAEGIERADQADLLRSLDCGLGQGFHFARALDPDAADAHLSAPLPGKRVRAA